MFVDVLPWWERCAYWIVGSTAMAYSVYVLFLDGDRYKNYMLEASFSPGWNWIGREQDQSDLEWWIWRNTLPKLILLNVIHVLLSQTCFYFKVSAKLHTCVLLIFDLVAAYIYLGLRIVMLHFSMALIMYAVSFLGSVSIVWLMTVIMITSLNYEESKKTEAKNLDLINFTEDFQFYTTSAFFYIRLTSFAIEKVKYRKSEQSLIDSKTQKFAGDNEVIKASQCKGTKECAANYCKEKKSNNDNFDQFSLNNNTSTHIVDSDPLLLDLLLYSFYLPTFLSGPIFIYKDFHSEVKASFTSSGFTPEVYDIVKSLVRIVFWGVFIDFQFHFLYYSAFGLYPGFIDKLPLWTIAGIGYCQGQFFMVKYLVLYGLAIQLSRFDGIVPIAAPRCVSWIYTYTDMWKHFDVGLYNFIKAYIYIPLGGSRAGLCRQIVASGLCFVFIFNWHGAGDEIFVWCAGNYLMGSLEAIAITLEQSARGQKLKSHLSPAMWLRFKVIFIIPVYLASGLQILFFFFDVQVGLIFVRRLVTQASWLTLITQFFFFTACIHNAIYLTQRFDSTNRNK